MIGLDVARRLADEVERTTTLQRDAADPAASCWVSANAGTGKTHVLTNRVLRLLLAGTKPERILCLTFTKAAAAEMSSRVFDRLARWVTLDAAKLAGELSALEARAPTAEELARARDLFTLAIETPGGLKVQTIHAFCERLLQRFPLEAGVSPQFAILDEDSAKTLEREAIGTVLAAAAKEPDGRLGRALTCAVAHAVDQRFDTLIGEALRCRTWLEAATRLDEGGARHAGAEHLYRRLLGIRRDATAESVAAELGRVLEDHELERLLTCLRGGSANDLKAAEHVSRALKAPGVASRIAALTGFLLTGEGEPRKALLTQKLAGANPGLAERAREAQERFCRLSAEYAALGVLEATMALLTLADVAHQHYLDLKRRRAALDYDDLIRKAADLLGAADQAEWVLYKLDGGLDHILVDEAQDTSPEQWRIVAALAAEFFAGEGRDDAAVRTLFAVGDEKQSIYGFQGAVPEKFAEMGRLLQGHAEAVGRIWRRIPLTLSFRTVAPILDSVDRVFAGSVARVGVSAEGQIVRHAAHRLGAAGLVEIWDPVKAEPPADPDVWAPSAEVAAQAPVTQVAERIAATIDGWLKNGERLASEGRLVRAGDILVLVRKRAPFAPAMVAALKARGIPVAGADRVHLAEQLVVADLVALADFLLLPEDDLALATVLKSPLVGLTDEDLMIFAPERKGASLWSSLLGFAAKPEHAGRLGPAAETLKRWRGRADLAPPFEFFSEVLERDGMRGKLLARLGPEAADPLDAFINLALSYDDGAPASLQGFIDWFRLSERVIKRDMELGRDEVRVLTVHGAKGLEAPIVFLPDTCSTKGNEGPLVGVDPEVVGGLPTGLDEPPFFWSVKGAGSRVAVVSACRAAARERDDRERNRLLYVALTRPRDRLYIAGFEGTRGRAKHCWWDLISEALAGQLATEEDGEGRRVRRLASVQEGKVETPRGGASLAVSPQPVPEWASRPAPREPALVVPLAPSRLAPLDVDAEGEPVERRPDPLSEPPVLPPRAASDGNRFLRGTLTHGLLQHLPGVATGERERIATGFVAARGRELKPRTRASVVRETLAVLSDPVFAPIFAPGSRAEVPIVASLAVPGSGGRTLRVNGQIDRLVRLEREILIVDYKTNRPPPTEVGEVPEAYLLQLAAYRLAVGQVFDGLAVRAALLWTEAPRLMEIPSAMLDAAVERLYALEKKR